MGGERISAYFIKQMSSITFETILDECGNKGLDMGLGLVYPDSAITEQVEFGPPRGEEAANPPKSKKRIKVRVLNPDNHCDTMSLRDAERLEKRGKAHLDRAKLTLRFLANAPDIQAAGRVYKRMHQVAQSPTVEVVPFTEPVDPFGIPTNRIGLPVVPHYSGRSLDDYLDHAEHDARQKAS